MTYTHECTSWMRGGIYVAKCQGAITESEHDQALADEDFLEKLVEDGVNRTSQIVKRVKAEFGGTA